VKNYEWERGYHQSFVSDKKCLIRFVHRELPNFDHDFDHLFYAAVILAVIFGILAIFFTWLLFR
jgi:hypothetical protein